MTDLPDIALSIRHPRADRQAGNEAVKDTATTLLPGAPVWHEPQWFYETVWHKSSALR